MKRVEMSSKLVPSVAVLAIAAIFLAGCTSYSGSNSPTAIPSPSGAVQQPGPASVSISNFAFSPASLAVSKGTTVTWANGDSVPHTVASDSGVFNSGSIASGSAFSYTFNNEGSFSYHCGIHSGMTGKVVVQ
ncbi:MAG: plastocyanin/azurin family copper-binding protein [Candidatus Micrarchaeia archaeon]